MAAMNRIPTNMITGLLGAGKTTAIRHLLESAPAGARWAVLVNEFGEVPIDQATLGASAAGRGFAIREVAGGCICCTGAESMREAAHALLAGPSPQRLLIEPTGLGHPARIIDLLKEGDLGRRLELKALIALADPRQLEQRNHYATGLFRDLISLADVVLAAKADLASLEQRRAFQRWAENLFPPKAAVGEVVHGRIDPGLLEVPLTTRHDMVVAHYHGHTLNPAHAPLRQAAATPLPFVKRLLGGKAPLPAGDNQPQPVPRPVTPERPARYENQGFGHRGCGWIFHPALCFDPGRLLAAVGALAGEGLAVQRFKGIFRVPGSSRRLLIDRVGEELFVERELAYQRDSRMEVIVADGGAPPPWDAVERRILACRAG